MQKAWNTTRFSMLSGNDDILKKPETISHGSFRLTYKSRVTNVFDYI